MRLPPFQQNEAKYIFAILTLMLFAPFWLPALVRLFHGSSH